MKLFELEHEHPLPWTLLLKLLAAEREVELALRVRGNSYETMGMISGAHFKPYEKNKSGLVEQPWEKHGTYVIQYVTRRGDVSKTGFARDFLERANLKHIVEDGVKTEKMRFDIPTGVPAGQ